MTCAITFLAIILSATGMSWVHSKYTAQSMLWNFVCFIFQLCRLKQSNVSQVVMTVGLLLPNLIRLAVAVVPVEVVDLAMSLLEKEALFVRAVQILMVSDSTMNSDHYSKGIVILISITINALCRLYIMALQAEHGKTHIAVLL